jgi:HAD superfamily hydrolase (TIGR01490 family)
MGGIALEKLAIFDVDFTLTKRETLIEFYRFMLKEDARLAAKLPKILFSAIMYAFKLVPLKNTKEYFISFIDGITEEQMKKHVKDFYEKRLSKIIYKDAIETIRKFKRDGYKIYLISASAEFYLNELYNINEVDKVIGTRFICEGGAHKSKIIGENCKGEEKVIRLMEELKKENINVDFKNSYMFSDSLSDLPLFKLVGNPYLINYRKNHDTIKILKWK